MVRDSGMITLASAFSSGINFVELLSLGGGMPTRVSIPESRMDEAIEKINAALGDQPAKPDDPRNRAQGPTIRTGNAPQGEGLPNRPARTRRQPSKKRR